MNTRKRFRIGILGDGGWGTALAVLLCAKGYPVTLWGAFPENLRSITRCAQNKRFLPGIKISRQIKITAEIHEAVSNQDLLILAVPSQYLRQTLKKIRRADLKRNTVVLSVIKGIEIRTLKRISEVVHEQLGSVKFAVLSGPTIAYEVAHGVPTVAVAASHDLKVRKIVQDVFITSRFRVYTNDDVAGVELGGSLKNIIAIACGACDGLGFGTNTKAAILARGLAEISRLGIMMGAKAKTFSGISGLGDLVTTCISPHSRNRSAGEAIARGRSVKDIVNSNSAVAEGIPTAKSAYRLSLKYGVEMPIVKEVYNVLYRKKSVIKALNDLMERDKKEE
jgi:glycerol-3-phosphate dehydrogenase (NAD(P)+)